MSVNKKALIAAAAVAAGALAAIDATIQHEENLGHVAGDELDDEDSN